MHVNIDEAVYKCESSACLFPFHNFKYKNFTDRTIFRYERINTTDEPRSGQKMYTSPSKVEINDIMEDFNLNWLDHSSTTESDLDSILTLQSDVNNSDIKEIINDICNNMDMSSINFDSPSKVNTINDDNSSNTSVPKLSKCLQYIENLSPSEEAKIPFSKKKDNMIAKQISRDFTANGFNGSTAENKSSKRKRKMLKKNQKAIIDQKPLMYLDWLETVRKIEPKQLHEFEFVTPTIIVDDHKDTFVEKNSPGNAQPILVEFMGTSASYLLDDQIPNNVDLCLPHRPDVEEIQATHNDHDSQLDLHPKDPFTSQSQYEVSSAESLPTTTNPANTLASEFNQNATDSIKEESSCFVKKYCRRGRKPLIQTGAAAKMKYREERRMANKIKMEQRLEELKQMEGYKDNVNSKRKMFNIEKEENFNGFEKIEPLKRPTFQTKPSTWL